MARRLTGLWLFLLVALLLSGCAAQGARAGQEQPAASVEFTLRTGMVDGRMAFIGVGGEIDGVANPDLPVQPGDLVRLVLENGDGMPHDVALPVFGIQSSQVSQKGDNTQVIFEVGAKAAGAFPYYCMVIGHRQAGMDGRLVVGSRPGSE